MLLQIRQQFQRHLFFVKSIAANGTAGRQIEAALRHDDAGPQNTGGVKQVEAGCQRDPLLNFCNASLIACLGGALAGQGVDQG